MKNTFRTLVKWIKNIPRNAMLLIGFTLKHPVFWAWLKISALLIFTLGLGPIFYVTYEWPHDLKPRNYFEFLNTGLLLFLTYHLILKQKSKIKCWLDDD